MKAKTNKYIFEHLGRKWTKKEKVSYQKIDLHLWFSTPNSKLWWEMSSVRDNHVKVKGFPKFAKRGQKPCISYAIDHVWGKHVAKKYYSGIVSLMSRARGAYYIRVLFFQKNASFLILHNENIKRANFQMPFGTQRWSYLACLRHGFS